MVPLRYSFSVPGPSTFEALFWGHPRNYRESSAFPGFSSLDVMSNPQSQQLGKSTGMAKVPLDYYPSLSDYYPPLSFIKSQSPENLSLSSSDCIS